MSTPPLRAWCVVHGTPGSSYYFIEGPFANQFDAESNAAQDQAKTNVSAVVVELVNPANC